jgi:hypothetical protein
VFRPRRTVVVGELNGGGRGAVASKAYVQFQQTQYTLVLKTNSKFSLSLSRFSSRTKFVAMAPSSLHKNNCQHVWSLPLFLFVATLLLVSVEGLKVKPPGMYELEISLSLSLSLSLSQTINFIQFICLD